MRILRDYLAVVQLALLSRCIYASCPLSGNTLTAMNGVLSDGPFNYPVNENCFWIIAVPNKRIYLYFKSYDMEDRNDNIHIYSCDTATCSQKQELTGSPVSWSTVDNYFVSKSGFMYVSFTSDSSGISSGFIAAYIAIHASADQRCSALIGSGRLLIF